MKGIILAGGSGTRLNPLTSVVSKQLLPVFDKPLVYYPLSTLISMGISEILIISSPEQISSFTSLLGNGSRIGIDISYATQDQPKGIAEALIIGEDFIEGDNCALILGDNIFISDILTPQLVRNFVSGAHIFTTAVEDPYRYGVLREENGQPAQIIEKPDTFVSNQAVTGLYFYDEDAVEMCKNLTPSKRNELEITELNQLYLVDKKLRATHLGNSAIWMDAGTFDSLQDSSNCISSMQKRLGKPVGSPEYSSFIAGFTSKEAILEDLSTCPTNDYYSLLKKSIND